MTKFSADTVEDFMAKANAAFGSNKLVETHSGSTYTYQFKDGKLAKLDFKWVNTPSYAEAGSINTKIQAHKDAIKLVADLAKAHELNHVRDNEKVHQAWNEAKVKKELMGKHFKSEKDAKAAIEEKIKDLNDKLHKACVELHKTEGYVDVVHNITVKSLKSGPEACR